MKILLVEDDQSQSERLEKVLKSHGHQVNQYSSVEDVIKKPNFPKVDILLLDLILLGRSGDNLVLHLRKKHINIPILVLSGISQVDIKINLLNKGVDDYLTKPFNDSELLARINAISRRYSIAQRVEKIGDFAFYWQQNKVTRSGKDITLSNRETKILQLLVEQHGNAVPTEEILQKIWKSKPGYHSNVVPSTIKRLRKKIDSDFEYKTIQSVHGVGYQINLPE